jgi:hypothetical protein
LNLLSANDAPNSLQKTIPYNLLGNVTAHDVPYPEFTCQVMMLLAKKFSANEKQLALKHMNAGMRPESRRLFQSLISSEHN